MSSTEEYKNLQITTSWTLKYLQGILPFPNCISYERFSSHDNEHPASRWERKGYAEIM